MMTDKQKESFHRFWEDEVSRDYVIKLRTEKREAYKAGCISAWKYLTGEEVPVEPPKCSVEKGSLYLHKKSQRFYIIRDFAPIKNPNTREWVDGVVYEHVRFNKKTQEIYGDASKFSRPIEDFEERFIEV